MRKNLKRNREKNQFKRMLAQINSTRPKAAPRCRKKYPSTGSTEEPSPPPEPEGQEASPLYAASRGRHPPTCPPVAFPGRRAARELGGGAQRRSSARPRELADWRAGSTRGTAGAGGERSHPRARRSAPGQPPGSGSIV